MRSRAALLLSARALTLPPSPAAAADIRQGSEITVGTTETVEDDLYAFGQTIAINGTVRGDLIAVGESVSVDGVVTRDVIAAARIVSIGGQVGRIARAARASIFVDGRVAGHTFGAGNEITVSTH